MSGKGMAERVARLEAWVDVVMDTLASLGLEDLLTELDGARGADPETMFRVMGPDEPG
jgi:hypothetical protein